MFAQLVLPPICRLPGHKCASAAEAAEYTHAKKSPARRAHSSEWICLFAGHREKVGDRICSFLRSAHCMCVHLHCGDATFRLNRALFMIIRAHYSAHVGWGPRRACAPITARLDLVDVDTRRRHTTLAVRMVRAETLGIPYNRTSSSSPPPPPPPPPSSSSCVPEHIRVIMRGKPSCAHILTCVRTNLDSHAVLVCVRVCVC